MCKFNLLVPVLFFLIKNAAPKSANVTSNTINTSRTTLNVPQINLTDTKTTVISHVEVENNTAKDKDGGAIAVGNNISLERDGHEAVKGKTSFVSEGGLVDAKVNELHIEDLNTDHTNASSVHARKGASYPNDVPAKLKPEILDGDALDDVVLQSDLTKGNENLANNLQKESKTLSKVLRQGNTDKATLTRAQEGHPKLVLPVVITMVALPVFAAIAFFALRRGQEAWKNRHYKRMDYLIDGMYND